MTQRLAAERNGPEPATVPEGYEDGANRTEPESDKVGDGYEEALDPARQAEAGDASELTDPEVEEPTDDEPETEEAVTETSEADTETETEEPSAVAELRQRAEQAEERTKMMERDYRVKTHKIAAAVREVEQSGEVVQQHAQFYANLASQQLAAFENVNWEQLKTDPAKYQQTRAQFQQALNQRDAMHKALGQIGEQHKQLVEQSKDREAEVSRDILKTTVPGWSNELYGKLRAFALEELAYTAEEFDGMTDWRRIRDVHAQYQIAQAPKSVAKLPRKKGKQPVGGQRERQVIKAQRDAKGRYQRKDRR